MSASPSPAARNAIAQGGAERPWLESLVACVPHGLALVDPAGIVVWSNRELSQLLGHDRSLKGTSMATHIDEWAAVSASIGAALAREPRVSCTIVLMGADGDRLPAVLHAGRCAPGVAAAWSLHVEVTQELEEVRRQLSDRERSYSFLRASTSDLIVRADARLVVTWRNEGASVLFGVGASLGELLAPEGFAQLERIAAAPFDSERRVDVAIESRAGARPMFFLKGSARRLAGDDGAFEGLAMILRDHSENRRLAMLSARLSMTPREEEIIDYLLQGYSNLNIATILGLSESGVKFHIRNVFGRAQVNTRTELMAMVMSQ